MKNKLAELLVRLVVGLAIIFLCFVAFGGFCVLLGGVLALFGWGDGGSIGVGGREVLNGRDNPVLTMVVAAAVFVGSLILMRLLQRGVEDRDTEK